VSFSQTIQAATKAAVREAVAAKVAEIVASQPEHANDQAAVLANVDSVMGLLADDDTKDVTVTFAGFVQWTKSAGPYQASSNSTLTINCTVAHAERA